MKDTLRHHLLAALLGVAGTAQVSAQNNLVTYQGRVQVAGTNFTGTGQFKFALVNAGVNLHRTATATPTVAGGRITAMNVSDGGFGYREPPAVFIIGIGTGASATAAVSGSVVTSIRVDHQGSGYFAPPQVTIASPPPGLIYTTFSSNDGTGTIGDEPAAPVRLAVDEGLFTVGLGDTALANMQPLPVAVFTNQPLFLRLWFNDDVHGFARLSPDQRLTPAGYALVAGRVESGSVDAGQLADGAVTMSAVADGSLLPEDLNFGAVGPLFWHTDGNAGTSPDTHFLGTTDNQPLEFKVNGTRVLRLQPHAGGTVLMSLYDGSLTVNGTFVSTSDRNAKENCTPVNPRQVLDQVAALPLSEWNDRHFHQAATRQPPTA